MQHERFRGFVADLERAAGAMARSPFLVLASLAPGVLFAVALQLRSPGQKGFRIVIELAAELAMVGFVGTQRIWFLRAYRGAPTKPAEVARLTAGFFPRFALLGLPAGTVIVVGVSLANALARSPVNRGPGPVGAAHGGLIGRVSDLVIILAIDVAWTFVVPALALSTRSVADAYRRGWDMIRQHWPATAWYVCTPGIALGALNLLAPREPAPVRYLLAIAGGLLAVSFKGAALAFYLRWTPDVGDSGSAGRAVPAPVQAVSVRRGAKDGDGLRVLVDAVAHWSVDVDELDVWFPEVAPPAELSDWYKHNPGQFAEFSRHYRATLDGPQQQEALHSLRETMEEDTVTLLTAHRRPALSAVGVLAEVLLATPTAPAAPGDGSGSPTFRPPPSAEA